MLAKGDDDAHPHVGRLSGQIHSNNKPGYQASSALIAIALNSRPKDVGSTSLTNRK